MWPLFGGIAAIVGGVLARPLLAGWHTPVAHERAPAFSGFPPAVFAWFEGLEADNSRAYVQRTRDVLDGPVRDGMEALLDELAGEEFGHEVKLFRQHRDLRFSRDKSPYKTRTYGLVARRRARPLRRALGPRPYAGTGFYRPERETLARFRDAVLDDADRARARGARRRGARRRGSRSRARRCARRPAACRATIRGSRCCATRR